jgi:hypothetical protein
LNCFVKGADGLFNYRISGKGTLAITGYGGLYRLILQPNEEYLISPKHLIAWDAAMDPTPEIGDDVDKAAVSSAPVAPKTVVKQWDAKTVGLKVWEGVKWFGRFLAWKTSKYFAGDKVSCGLCYC